MIIIYRLSVDVANGSLIEALHNLGTLKSVVVCFNLPD